MKELEKGETMLAVMILRQVTNKQAPATPREGERGLDVLPVHFRGLLAESRGPRFNKITVLGIEEDSPFRREKRGTSENVETRTLTRKGGKDPHSSECSRSHTSCQDRQ